ncbi:MAG: xly [Verrucomicrobiales bacterium]|nr:xly [Verrucomicrobiales bacterium]
MKKAFPLLLSLLCLQLTTTAAEKIEADICVYGGTAAGVVASVQAARMGKSVVLLEFGRHLGGMTSGGLSQTDIGNKAAIGGISLEFYQRMGKHYGTNEAWKLEPSVAESVLRDFIREEKIPVHFDQHLASVKKKDGRITEIKMENGNVVRAKEFIDATYEGDLMAKAKVSYHVGREANSVYNETINGIREQTPKHQFLVAVDPYKTPGDPKSGLLTYIQKDELGKPGDGDHTVQAYNFRMCITQNKTNQIPITPPSDYDASRFELLARYLEARIAAGQTPKLTEIMHIQPMPNGKTDINNNGGFSTDFIGANYDYPDADYKQRAKIWKAHENYTRSFFHFLATSPRVPESMRKDMQSWGLCKNEFTDTGGWPHQLYVREARRMISDYVMNENDCRAKRVAEDSIGLAAYNMDSHNCRRLVRFGHAENEGDVQVAPNKPYAISYRSLVPKQSQCENLFVPVCLSSSHAAYGSIRMEPVFMLLGQSAATAAAHAIDENVPAQKIDYPKLRARLLADKQVLEWQTPKR